MVSVRDDTTAVDSANNQTVTTNGSPARGASRSAARIPHVLAAGICLIAVLATSWVASAVFDRLPHLEDDVAFLFQAQTIASGQIIADAPALPDFFWIPFVIEQDGQWFGKYPLGYPAVLALGVLSGHPWLLNPLIGALTVGLTYLAGRRLYGPSTGLVAAALLAVSPFFLLQAGSFLSHTSSLFWAMVFLLLFESVRRRRSPWIALVAGMAIGMLLLSRPLTAVGIGVPYVIWAGIDILRDRTRLPEYLLIIAGFTPFAAVLLGYNQMTTGDPLRFAYELWWPYDRVGFGEGYGYGGAHSLEAGWFNTQHNLEALSDYLFGWPGRLSLVPALAAAAAAVIRLGWRGGYWINQSFQGDRSNRARQCSQETSPEAWDLLQIGVVVGLIGVHVAYWTAGQMYGPRYYFEAMGALVLLSSRGIVQTASSLGDLLRQWIADPRTPAVFAWAATIGLVSVLVLHNFFNFAPEKFEEFTGWYGIDRSGLEVIEQHDLENALVFVSAESWTDYAPFFTENRPSLDTNIVYARDLGERNPELMRIYPNRSYFHFDNGELRAIDGPG